MQKGKTLRFIVMFLIGLLATASSVYAAHFGAAGVQSQITDDTSVQFWFLGVFSPPDDFEPVIPTQFQCTVEHTGKSMPFRLFTSVKKIESFTVVTSGPKGSEIDTITITGKVLSHIFVSRPGVRLLTEEASFKVVGVDKGLPEDREDGEKKETFDLKFVYRADGIGALLAKALGSKLVVCQDHTCTLKLAEAKTVEAGEGEIEAHTSGGD